QVVLVSSTDSAIVEFTTNNGSTWRMLGEYNSTSGQFHDSLGNSVWQNVTFDMSSYVGDTVAFRFRLRTSAIAGIQKPGWYIDDIALQSPNAVAEPAVPVNDLVMTNYPNPFTGSTTLSISGLPVNADNARPSLVISDVAGNIVADLSSQILQTPNAEVTFDAHTLPAGTYYALLRTANSAIRRELIVIK
ncbi:MAG TPA: T9SS type A sorting domain-containing protein, partial [Candidatus Kapabacteria bacterium]|nr:T9SS type A sorting domain-containing protein [Candidatus Kapabacteria bacterium]